MGLYYLVGDYNKKHDISISKETGYFIKQPGFHCERIADRLPAVAGFQRLNHSLLRSGQTTVSYGESRPWKCGLSTGFLGNGVVVGKRGGVETGRGLVP